MTNDKPSAGLLPWPFCVADFLDDIEVDDKGMCRWSDVANAQTHIRHSMRAALRAASTPPATGDVRRETIEECAAVCDKHAKWAENMISDNDDPASARSQMFATMSNAANDCAELIRDLASVAPGPSEAAIQKSAPVG